MPVSLNVFVASIVSVIAIIVAAVCVSLTLTTFTDQIDSVGRGWASGLTNGVLLKLANFMNFQESLLNSAAIFCKTSLNKLPSDLAADGVNWTENMLSFQMNFMNKQNFQFNSFAMIFMDNNGLTPWWTYCAPSFFMPGGNVMMMEWIEFFNTSGPATFGGRRFWKDNASVIPYDVYTNYQPEGAAFVYAKPTQTSNFQGLIYYTGLLKAAAVDKTAPIMLWSDNIGWAWYPEKNIFWEQFGTLIISNTSGYVIGYASIGIGLDKELAKVLRDCPRTKNGHIFLTDRKGYLVSTTYSEPFFTYRNSTLNTTIDPILPGCDNSRSQPFLAQASMGCRYYYANYSFYKPLIGLEHDFVLSSGHNVTDVSVDGQSYVVSANRYATPTGLAFNLVNFVPWNDLTGNVAGGRNMAIGIAVAIFVAAVIIAIVVTYFTLAPLARIAAKMEKTARLEGLDKDEELDDDESNDGRAGAASTSTDPKSPTESSRVNAGDNDSDRDANEPPNTLSLTSASMIKEIANLEIAYAFSHNQLVNFTRYVPKNVVKEVLIKGKDVDLMVPTHCAISFVDQANFTSMVEKLSASSLSALLHAYFKKMTRLVMAHGGIVDRFVGDCIVAVWGAPFKIERHELLAALCAIAYQRETQKNPLKQLFLDQGINLAVRVGVASGNVLAGNVGSRDRKSYTVLGEAVQTADKLEAYNKYWGTGVMVSEEVARECNDELVLRLLTRIKLQGRAKPVMVYHCMGVQPDAKINKKKNRSRGSGSEGNQDSGSSSEGSSEVSGTNTNYSHTDSLRSATTANSHSLSDALSMNSSNSSGGLLPSNVKLDRLLAWHQKRNACDDNTVAFANEFNEAARCTIDHDFAGALKKLQALEADNWIPEKWKTHKSVSLLKELIKKAMQGGNESINASTSASPFLKSGGTPNFFVNVE